MGISAKPVASLVKATDRAAGSWYRKVARPPAGVASTNGERKPLAKAESLDRQQHQLVVASAGAKRVQGILAGRSIAARHTVTWDDDRQRAGRDRTAHGPRSRRPPHIPRDLAVAPHLAPGYIGDRGEHGTLERSAATQIDGEVESAPLACKVFAHLRHRRRQHRWTVIGRTMSHPLDGVAELRFADAVLDGQQSVGTAGHPDGSEW